MPIDFFPTLSRAIRALDHDTPEARHAIYNRARQMVLRNEKIGTPPASEESIRDTQSALEEAIWRVELEVAPARRGAMPGPVEAFPGASSNNEFDGSIDAQSMRYVQSILQPGERILARGKYHWIIYGWAVIDVLFGALFLTIGSAGPGPLIFNILGFGFLILAPISALKAWFKQWISEIAVTNFRVVRKSGFIRRQTWEMNMDKVESVTVDQSILGRILGYGTIHVLGTGEGLEHLHNIRAPIELRNRIVAR